MKRLRTLRMLRIVLCAAAAMLSVIAATAAVSAGTSNRAEAWQGICRSLKESGTVYYAKEMDLDNDGTPELVTVWSDGIIRAYDDGNFSSRYILEVFVWHPSSGTASSAGRLTGLFYDGGSNEGFEALACAEVGGERLLVLGGQNMDYRYRFYGLRDGRMKLVKSFSCEWSRDECSINGKNKDRNTFMEELRRWQKRIHFLRYFDASLSSEKQPA